MNFEWDENKRQRNIEKHTLDFLDAVQLFDGRPVVSTYYSENKELRGSDRLEGHVIP
jgi:uncharacterized DUF497 family protein